MNSFKRFGIDHLSASSLNKWMSEPGWWAWHYIGGNREETSAAMVRGTSVENGLVVYLQTKDESHAVGSASNVFFLNYKGCLDSAAIAEHNLIEPMLRRLIKWWKPPSQLNATQIKIEYWLDHIPVPIIGFVDMGFDGIDIDLKTTKACPSAPRIDHVRQIALYRAARGRNGGLLYVTDKKHAYYEVTDEMMEEGLKQLGHAALSMNNLLARCDTKEDVLRCLPRNPDSFYAPKNKELVS